jgi:hypothetical protein
MSIRVQAIHVRIKRKEAERAAKVAYEGNTTKPEEDTSSKVEQADSNPGQHTDNSSELRHRMQKSLCKANEQGHLETILKQVADCRHSNKEPQIKAKHKAEAIKCRQNEQEENEAHAKIRKVETASIELDSARNLSDTAADVDEAEVETDDDLIEDIYSQLLKDEERVSSESSNKKSTIDRKSFRSNMDQLISLQSTSAKRRRTESQPSEPSNSANASARMSKTERLHGQQNEVRKDIINSKLIHNTKREEARAITALLYHGKGTPKMKYGHHKPSVRNESPS